jgi:cephalosporin-C deacetylase-like acetyl esterase
MPKPPDFDAFWAEKCARMAAIPFNAELTPVPACTDDATETYALILDGLAGTKVRGFLSKPRGDGPFPVVMTVYGAGVFSIGPSDSWAYARQGAMAVNINPHDMLNGQPREYYRDLQAGALKNYMYQGRDDRDKSYFLRMFCACYQTARYVTSRPEWDGERFAVWGSSQGGAQAIVTAYLCPRVTAVAANVPALCDHTGPVVGRAAGWPKWVRGENAAQQTAARYYDAVNFSQSVRARAVVCVGLIDRTCPPTAVYAVYNGLRGPKEMVVTPLYGHAFSPAWNAAKEAFISHELGRGISR